MSYIGAIGLLVTSSLGFKARVGCHIYIAEAYITYIPSEPHLVLHIANSQHCGATI